jgi:hypothetical protein
MSTSPSLFERAKTEIIGLHRYFADWYNAADSDQTDFSRFENVLGEGFRIVTPDDGRIIDRDSIISHVRANHSCFHGDFTIEIEDVRPASGPVGGRAPFLPRVHRCRTVSNGGICMKPGCRRRRRNRLNH